jgi:hypothetical protein
VLNKATLEVKAFSATIVTDPIYQARVRERALKGELTPALEVMLWPIVSASRKTRCTCMANSGCGGTMRRTANDDIIDHPIEDSHGPISAPAAPACVASRPQQPPLRRGGLPSTVWENRARHKPPTTVRFDL